MPWVLPSLLDEPINPCSSHMTFSIFESDYLGYLCSLVSSYHLMSFTKVFSSSLQVRLRFVNDRILLPNGKSWKVN